jgi:hypothetical protein
VLLQTFLNDQHPEHPVLEPASLSSALEAIYECLSAPLDTNPLHNGWPSTLTTFRWNGQYVRPTSSDSCDTSMPVIAFIFFMIFNIAATTKIRARIYEYSPEKFYRSALLFVSESFSRTTLSGIQALVLLIIRSLLSPNENNLWTLVHIGIAHCIELGLHRRPAQVSQEDMDHQRVKSFIFFTVYSLDR